MSNTLKLLRNALNISQEEFGNKLGVTKTAISKLENNERNLTPQMSLSICREFNVNDEWLKTGEGEMFKDIPEEDEVAAYVSELLEDNGDNPLYTLIKEIMHTYDQLDNKSQDVLRSFSKMLLDNLNKKEEG